MTKPLVEINPADFAAFGALHAMMADAFAPMAARIDPPSSMTRLTAADVAAKARAEDLYLIRQRPDPIACLFGQSDRATYYVGKLAVAPQVRRQGLALALIEAAAARARASGHSTLALSSRVELTENHALFHRAGFRIVARTAHSGFDRPTSLTFHCAL